MFSKGELSNIIQSTQEIYLETNVNNMHNPPTNMDNILCPAENSFLFPAEIAEIAERATPAMRHDNQ